MQLLSKLSKLPVANCGLIIGTQPQSRSIATKKWYFLPEVIPKSKSRFMRPPETTQALHHRFVSSFKTQQFATPKSIAKFHAIDELSPKSFTLIYKSGFQWYLIIGQITVLLAIGALVVFIPSAYILNQVPPESKIKQNLETKARLMESEKISRNELRVSVGLQEPSDPKIIENVPSVADVISDDFDYICVFLALLVLMSFSIFRLMTMLPVRIYVGQMNHCVGVYYGSIIPGRLVKQDFVAGTLKPLKKSYGSPNTYFKDGSGRTYVLFEHYFRRPADFNYLTGFTKAFDLGEDSDELSQLKNVGSFGTNPPKK
ncbi:uncharacterized protein LOC110852385 [Folsomia candida]|uniref:uncharacterized protein LOC110852385 n=1 Tax=Folsomia candida TaxID=158441 RepID=UPI000B8FF716|nr:uncharacterized protein LOC110852385 [Folsomia candida]